jgi:hypothetical protein
MNAERRASLKAMVHILQWINTELKDHASAEEAELELAQQQPEAYIRGGPSEVCAEQLALAVASMDVLVEHIDGAIDG